MVTAYSLHHKGIASKKVEGVSTEAEWGASDSHRLDQQAIGDLIYASSASQLRRLGVGAAGQFLAVSGGVPVWTDTISVDAFIANGFGLVIGHTAQITAGALSEFQVLGTALADASTVLGMWSADAVGPDFQFVKSRATTIGSFAILVDNDVIGRFVGLPDDGVDYATVAGVYQMEVDDASPAAGDVGVAHVWLSMAGGGAALTERMRLTASGQLLFGNAAGPAVVDVAAESTVPTLIPNKAALTSGLGSNGADQPSLIVGGAEIQRWTATGINTNVDMQFNGANLLMVTNFIELKEMTEPGVPGADRGRLFVVLNGTKSELKIRFQSGVSQQIAIEP